MRTLCIAAVLLLSSSAFAKGNTKAKVAIAKAAKVEIAEAITKATAKVPGKVIEVELAKKKGRAVWEIEVLKDDGHTAEVDVATDNGDVLDTEEQKK